MSILTHGGRILAALTATALVTACGGSDSSPATGDVSVRLTDMPVDHADQVVIAVSGLAFKPEGSGPEQVIDFTPRAIDLLQYQNGLTAVLLQDTPMEAGRYQWLRLIADTEIALRELLRLVEQLAGASDRGRFGERAERWADASRARSENARKAARAVATKSPISPLWLSYQIGEAIDDNCIMLDETLMLSPLPPYLRFSEPATYFRNPGSGGGGAHGRMLQI